MNEMGLKYKVRMKKYHSNSGTVSKIAHNILDQNSQADNIIEKWVTEVTELHLFGE